MFINYDNFFYILSKVIIKIWYGEDFWNWRVVDNGGKVCVDVYVDFK